MEPERAEIRDTEEWEAGAVGLCAIYNKFQWVWAFIYRSLRPPQQSRHPTALDLLPSRVVVFSVVGKCNSHTVSHHSGCGDENHNSQRPGRTQLLLSTSNASAQHHSSDTPSTTSALIVNQRPETYTEFIPKEDMWAKPTVKGRRRVDWPQHGRSE